MSENEAVAESKSYAPTQIPVASDMWSEVESIEVFDYRSIGYLKVNFNFCVRFKGFPKAVAILRTYESATTSTGTAANAYTGIEGMTQAAHLERFLADHEAEWETLSQRLIANHLPA